MWEEKEYLVAKFYRKDNLIDKRARINISGLIKTAVEMEHNYRLHLYKEVDTLLNLRNPK